MSAVTLVHGTALVIAGRGVLITGPSGSGKTLLALDLIDHATGRGESAALVADDQVVLTRAGDGLSMGVPEVLAGQAELRGRGIIALPHMAEAPLDLVVTLLETVERMPEPEAFGIEIAGVRVACCPVPRRGHGDPVHQRLLVRAALAALEIDPDRAKFT